MVSSSVLLKMLVSSEKQHMEVSLGSVEQALLKWLLRVSEPQFLHLCICVCVCERERVVCANVCMHLYTNTCMFQVG